MNSTRRMGVMPHTYQWASKGIGRMGAPGGAGGLEGGRGGMGKVGDGRAVFKHQPRQTHEWL